MDPKTLLAEAEQAMNSNPGSAATAEDLRRILKSLASALNPFPPFMGSWDVFGIECDLDDPPRKDLGCIIVNPQGDLQEFTFAFSPPSAWGAMERSDRAQGLNLTDPEYIAYAYAGICGLVREFEKRQGSGGP